MGEEELCRLCAESKSAADLLSIQDEYWSQQELDTKISRFFQIKISLSDKLPKSVCSKCCEKVIITSEFNEKIQQAQETLRSVLSEEDSCDSDSDPLGNLETAETPKSPDLVECLILGDDNQEITSNALFFSLLRIYNT